MKKETIYYIGEIILISGVITDNLLFLILNIFGIKPEIIVKGENYLYTSIFLLLSTLIIFFLFYFFQKVDTHQNEKLKIPIFKNITLKNILRSLLFFLIFYIFMIFTSFLLNTIYLKKSIFNNPLLKNIKNTKDFLIIGISSIVGGAFREELQRSFVLQRFDVIFNLPYLGLILWSIYFALGHINQGPLAIFIVGIIGLGLGIIYLKYKNYDINFFTHLFFNIFTLFSYFIYKNLF